MNYCYFNGKIISAKHAQLPVSDISILRGFAVFDAIRAEGTKIFHCDDHLNRFYNSARLMEIKVPVSKVQLKTIISKLLQKNRYAHSKIRIYLTGGNLVNNLEFNGAKPNFFVMNDPLPAFGQDVYTKGVSLITAEYQRSIPEVKTTDYSLAVHLQKKRLAKKAFEILYVSNGQISECSTSNFAIIKGKQLITAGRGILKGVTRKIILDFAKNKLGLKIIERSPKISELPEADEAFLTATYKGVVPVVKIDNVKIADAKPGQITKRLIAYYESLEA